MSRIRSLICSALAASLLAGCATAILRDDTVKRIAGPVFLIPRHIKAGDFTITARERVSQRNQPVTVYIEGDSAPGGKSASSPSPRSPIALRLAAQDGGPNVVWIPRPCQYLANWKDGGNCPEDFYNGKQYSPEIIDSFNAALDNIKTYYNIPSFDLVGYDGGAAIAVILGSQRSDISSLRTVAGNLDPSLTARINGGTAQKGSLDPMDFSAGVGHIPQRHFLGKQDLVTPPIVYNSFAQSVGNASCLNVSLVDNASHDDGWVEKWKVLKAIPIDCAQPPEPQPVKFDPTPLDGDKYKIRKKK